MAESAEDICNLALSRIGNRAFIDSLEAVGTAESIACKAVYTELRDQLLQKFAWPFAQRRATLALVVETGDRNKEWAYVYGLPTDCLQPQYIPSGASRTDGKVDRIPFVIESGEALNGAPITTTVLLTDLDLATLVYTSRVEAVNLYPPLFVNALAWMIAQELIFSLTVDPRRVPVVDVKLRQALNEAEGAALTGQEKDIEPDGKFVTGR